MSLKFVQSISTDRVHYDDYVNIGKIREWPLGKEWRQRTRTYVVFLKRLKINQTME